MPRTSRHKSHRQSKHNSKDVKDYISDTEEDLKVKERSYTRDEGRASKESSCLASGEKRKLDSSFQSKEGKEGKNIIYSGNGDAAEEYVSFQRREEKSEGIRGEVDRWTVVRDEKDDSGEKVKDTKGETLVNDSEKGLKSRDSKGSSDLKNRNSRRHESAAEKDERIVTSLPKGEEVENRSCSTRGDSKRISEKDSGRREGRGSKEAKETERVSDRESKKLPEDKQEFESRVIVGSVTKRHDLLIKGPDKDRPPKRAKGNSELTILDEFHTPELENERVKRIQKKREGSGDRDCYRNARESENMDVSSKEGRYKGERDKSRNHAEKYQDSKEKDDRYRDDKYREPADGDRDSRHRAEKYRDEGDRENKRREDRYRDVLSRDDNFGEDKDRENKRKDDKHSRRATSRYLEDEKYREKNNRYKDEKSREDYQRDRESRDDRQRDDFDKEKRDREKTSYRDDNYFRDLSGDKSDPKNFREENQSFDHQSRMLSIHDDDRARLKDAQGRKRTSDKEDYNDMKSQSVKDRRYDSEKRSTNDAGVDVATDRARSGSRYADIEANSVRSKNQGSPSSGSHATRDQYRLSKEDEFKYRDYAYQERVRHGGSVVLIDKISSSRSIEKVIPRDDGLTGELSVDRRVKTDIRNSPRQLVDKSPSSTSGDRRYLGRSDFRRSDVDVSLKEVKNYSAREGRGTRDLVSETRPGDEPSQGDADAISVSSPFIRNSSKSFSHPHPHPHPPSFRVGIDSPQVFRSGENDSRMKSNNRYNRRNGDPNMVRGSPWKGLPNWAASPVPNGFVPFHHGPPIGFHHAMQQFPHPAPPIMGLRPNMDLNHPGVPFSIPDPDRFPLHGHHLGWRAPMYDPCPPPLHGWESNDVTESRLSIRHDYNRTVKGGGRPWESVGDSLKSLKTIKLTTHTFMKDGNQSNQSSEHIKIEHPNHSAETCFGASHSNDPLDMKIPVSSDDVLEEETLDLLKTSEKDDAPFCHAYLSELDISIELTDPELYSRYRDILNVDDIVTSDSMDDQILYVEQQVSETKEKSSLFLSIDDSLLQKAVSLYKKRNSYYRENESYEDDTEVKEQLDPDMVPFHTIQNLNKPAVTDNVETAEDKSRNAVEHKGGFDSMGRQEQRAFASSVSMETGESSSGGLRGRDEMNIVPPPTPIGEDKKEEENLVVTKNGSMVMSNVSVSSKAHAVDVLSGSVNSNRIHYSPESTH